MIKEQPLSRTQIIEAIREINGMIDKINRLVEIKSQRPFTDVEERMTEGYGKKYSMFISGIIKLNGISVQEYEDNYKYFEEDEKKRLPRPKKPEMEAHNVAFRDVLNNPMFDGYDKDIMNAHLADFYCVFQLGVDWGREHPEKKVVKENG